MTNIVTRAGKGTPLTNNEVDANFVNLNTDKIETLTSTDASVVITGTGSTRNLSVSLASEGVSGPASATDNAVARFDTTTGKLIQNSVVTIDDSGNIAGANSISTIDYAQLDTAAAASIALGKLRWNTATATAAFGIIDGTTEVNIGEQMYAYVTNAESVTITAGQAVYLYAATGNRASVKLAYNTGDATSAKTLGLVTADIPAGGTGFVTTQGVLEKLNTSAFSEGDTLYLGATAGSLTATKPSAPNHLVYIGVVEKANAGNGQIYVRPQNGYELEELHNVQIISPTNGQTVIYDASTSLWKNANITAGTGISVTNGPGSITIANTGVTSVGGTGTVNGLTLSGSVTTSGNLTLSGAISGIPNSATTATSANTASAIVARDASGNFSAGTITATLSGNATTATTANALNTANSYTGVNFTATGSLIVGSSGTYSAGSLYSDANWGMLFRAKQASPAQAQFMWADSAGTELARITNAGGINATSFSGAGTGLTGTASSLSIGGNAATATNISNSGTVTLATATESNAITVIQPSYTTNKPVKLLNFDWYGNNWSLGNIRSGSVESNGFGIFYGSSNTELARFTTSGLTLASSTVTSARSVISDASAPYMTFTGGPGGRSANLGMTDGWNMYVNAPNGGNLTLSSFLAPIFSDINNTAYYCDPASTSNLNGLTVAATITGNISGNAATVSNLYRGDAGSTDLNSLTTSGFYRVNDGNANRPGSYGQLFVCYGGSDTIGQMYFDYGTGNTFTRAGNPSQVGGGGSWSSWKQNLNSGNYTAFDGHLRALGGADGMDFNTTSYNSMYFAYIASSPNKPTSYSYPYGTILTFDPSPSSSGRAQFYVSHAGNDLCFRGGWNANSSWTTWNRVLTDQTYRGYSDFTGGVAGTIYYDANDTGYYVNPNGASNISELTLAGTGHKYLFINPGNGYEAMVRYNGGSGSSWYVGKRVGGELVGTESFHFYAEAAGQTVGAIDTAGNMFARDSIRAPIFYDRNNTGYYLDPNSQSNLYRTTTYLSPIYQSGDWADAFRNTPTNCKAYHGDISSGGPAGTWWFYESMRHGNGSNYWGTQIAWGWEDNANQLRQRNISGNSFSGWVTYINSNNIGSQSVNYATTAGNGVSGASRYEYPGTIMLRISLTNGGYYDVNITQ